MDDTKVSRTGRAAGAGTRLRVFFSSLFILFPRGMGIITFDGMKMPHGLNAVS
jgi:hypothetical protein